jgi:hypothetical protein
MSERWLREITDINGVEGVLLVSLQGHFIEKMGTQFDRVVLEGISRNILRITESHELVEMQIKEVELAWYDYRILAMKTNNFALIIFCSSTKVISLLRITMNVVAAHLMEDKKIIKKIKKLSKDSSSVIDKNELDESEIKLISKLQ